MIDIEIQMLILKRQGPKDCWIANKLELRKKRLLKRLESENKSSKHKEELELSITKDLVRKFWVGCKG